MNIIKIKQADFRAEKWTGGVTEEIFILPEGASYKNREFVARVSSATIEKNESTFSVLPDVYRFICPLDKKLTLIVNDENYVELEPFEVFEFNGDTPIVGKGKCRDFNFMLKGNAGGYMKVWNTEKAVMKKIQLKKSSILWVFSYSKKCAVKVNDEEVEIGKMQFIKIDGMKKSVTLKTDCKTNLIYGVIY
ncbi:MAG: hypothetical protein CR988_02545 [Treponema sp.]|nr:MAG: hypothetical protein CR988_02545 [Treponema sp.]